MPGYLTEWMRARPSAPRHEEQRRRRLLPAHLSVFTLAPVLALSGVLYAGLQKDVTLVVDGNSRPVSTMSATVGELLAAESLPVDQHDLVTPSLESGLRDGLLVDVALAKELTLLLDEGERTVHVVGETVEEVLDQINLRGEEGSFVEPSRGATVEDGDTIVYRPALNVRLTVGGESRDVITNGTTVGFLIESLNVNVGPLDIVEPVLETELARGMDIRVTRVGIREATEQLEIPYDTRVVRTADLLEGVQRVAREGAPGLEERTYEVRTEDRRGVERKLLDTRLIREPQPRVVLLGTRPPRTQSGVATWYHRSGLVAAHQTLPLGTQVRVTNLDNGRTVTVVINDRGPHAPGKIIDLSDDAFALLAPLSSGTFPVRIAW